MSYEDSIQLVENTAVDYGEDIAIVGMSCRFPGAGNYREYWELLQSGVNAVSEIPEDRWKWSEFFGNPAKDKNKSNSKWGGFIDGIDEFDPLFFNISPTEARYIDPQHRLFLQEAYHAVEDAGYDIRQLAGRKVGVYAGVSKNDYAELMREENVEIESFVSTGTVHSILSNRVSYLFDLRGKSEVVDTACSSFLVALNNAVRDIRLGTCESAIVGGINLIMSPTMYVSHGKSGMLSGNGACRAFDKDADGYVRGEGVGVIFVKRLSDALLSNDNILGVIKGISVSHGGRGNFLTAPKASSQAETLREALLDGDIAPDSVSYLEAHGTGTPLGDPVEFEGIKLAYGGAGDYTESPCYLSSVKTNIGHLESAASVAGIIKILLSMKHGVIPKLLHFREANPLLRMDATRFRIAKENVSWGRIHGERSHDLRAGLSSFGMGGVNAHVVVERFSREKKFVDPINDSGAATYLVPISAGSRDQLTVLAKQLGQYLSEASGDIRLSDIAYTLRTGRRFEKHRKCFVVRSLKELLRDIGLFSQGEQREESTGVASAGDLSAVIERATAWESGEIEFAAISKDRPEPGARIPLPGYPFARRKCWYPHGNTTRLDVSDKSVAACSDNTANANAVDVREPTSSRNKQNFLYDHVVQGTAILPGVAYLAFVLNEYSTEKPGSDLGISDINWLRPCACDLYAGPNFTSDKKSSPEGDYIEFKVSDKVVVSLTARALDSAEGLFQRAINERPLGSQSVSDVEQIYGELRDSGLDYGPAFRVIRQAHWSGNELTASLACSPKGADPVQSTVTLLDGVFQAVVLLHNRLSGSKVAEQQVPFLCKRFVWHGKAMPDRCVARVTRVSNKRGIEEYEMGLFTIEGEQLCRFDSFIKRPYMPLNTAASDHTTDTLNSHLYTTNWLESPIGARAETATRILVYSEEPVAKLEYLSRQRDGVSLYQEAASANCHIDLQSDSSDLSLPNAPIFLELLRDSDLTRPLVYLAQQSEQMSEDSHYRLLYFVQQALRNKLKQGSDILYVHDLSERAVCQASIIAGFARTLKYENPNIRIRTLGLDEASMPNWEVHALAELESYDNSTLGEIRYVQGVRQIRSVQDYIKFADSPSGSHVSLGNTIIKQGGHYLICGGTGGIGLQFAKYLTAEFGASVHLVGRRKPDAGIAESLRALQAAGGAASYWQSDISDKQSTRDLFDQIAAQGIQLNGILQCAGLIEDSYIFNKSVESFSHVLAPKVSGTLNLDEASRDHKLDFMVLFSSVAALMPNQGQCDYAAANSFLDSFAYFRNLKTARGERSGRCVSINWPLWAKAGITVSESEERHLREVFGMDPITWATARKVFDFVLSAESHAPLNNIIAIDGDAGKIRHSLKVVAGEWVERSNPRVDTNLANSVATRDRPVSVRQIVELMLSEMSGKAAPIDGDENLSSAGFDSQALTVLADRINVTFGTDLNPVFFFERNTISQIQSFVDSVAPLPRIEADDQTAVDRNRTIYGGLLDILLCEPQNRIYRKRLSNREFFMRDHVVQGRFNVPGACFVEIAAQAFARDCSYTPNGNRMVLKNNFWAKQLSTLGAEIEVVVSLTEGREPDTTSYQISCDGEAPAGVYALGEMQVLDGLGAFEQAEMLDVESLVNRLPRRREFAEIYQYIVAEGLLVGDTFKPMLYAHVSQDEVFAECRLPENIRDTLSDYLLHPTLFTGVLQAALLNNKPTEIEDTSYIPMGVDEVVIARPLSSTCFITTQRRQLANDSMIRKYDAQVYNDKRELIAVMSGITLKSLSSTTQPEVEMITANPVDKKVSERDLESVQRMLIDIVATTVGLSAAEIDIEEQLDKYGLNSILVVDINRQLEDMFGSLSKTLLFEYQSVGELARYFAENHFQLLVEKQVISSAETIQQGEQNNSPAGHGNAETGGGRLPKTANGASENGAAPRQSAYLQDAIAMPGAHSANAVGEGRPVTKPLPNGRQRLPADAGVAPRGGTEQVSANTGENDIAIVGVAGRYPGANSIDELWNNLLRGVDNITSTPVDRFDPEALKLQDGAIDLRGCEKGGYLDDVEKFDAALFNISPREAVKLDPQERLFLETAWSTIESAGYDYTKLKGMNIGVYVGALWQPYVSLGIEEMQKGNLQIPTGLLYNIPNRVSYFFDWCGPSMVIDTACSSSLSALHMACNSIRSGEVSAALAGGVNLSFSASKHLWLASNKFLSSEGKCRSFGEGGDGYVPGEGVGAVFLKRLSQAVADGDNICGVIRATGANHGGRTNGFTVPNPVRQGELIRKSLDAATIDARSISYIEAHGTGTSLGDPIEITGLKRAFDPDGEPEQACAIGSVKSNIGHLEAAAGIAGLTKTLLQMKHRIKVPTLHSEVENQNLDFDDSSFYLQKKAAFWPKPTVEGVEQERLAMVSSFGAGGSNSHLIVSEFSDSNGVFHRTEALPENGGVLFPFSARSRQALNDYLRVFSRFLADKTSRDMYDMACTLQEGRHAMEQRILFTAASVKELSTKIKQYLATADADVQDSANVKEMQLLDQVDQLALLKSWLLSGDLSKVQRFWEFGGNIDWALLFGLREYQKAELPTYQFDRKEFRMQRISGAANRVQTIGTAVAADDGGDRVAGFSINNVSSLYRHVFELRPLTLFDEAQPKRNCAESDELISALAEICRRAMEADTVFDIDKSKLAGLDRGAMITVEIAPLFEGDELDALELHIDAPGAPGIVLIAQPHTSPPAGVSDKPGSDPVPSTQYVEQVAVVPNIAPERVIKTDEVPKRDDVMLNKPVNVTLRALPVSRPSEPERPLVGLVDTSADKTDKRDKPAANALDMDGLKASLAACLFMEPGDIDETATFSDIGLDSIVGVEWIDDLSKAHGIQLETSALYDYSTLLAFRDHIQGLLDHRNGADFTSPVTAPSASTEPAGSTEPPGSVEAAASKDISSVLLDELANVLYMDRSDVQMDSTFADIGLDSVVGVEWLDKINCRLGSALSTTVLYDFPSVRQLAQRVERGLEQGLYVHVPRGPEPALQLINSSVPEFDAKVVSG